MTFDPEAEQAAAMRFRFVVFTMVLLVVLNTLAAVTPLRVLGWRAVTFNSALILLLDVLFAWRHRDREIAGWLLFGIIAGVIELGTDWWLVAKTHTLTYPSGEPMLWASPAYMPFAWAMILTQVGVVGAWLARRHGLAVATIATALIGGVNIPLYEHLAKGANWWAYHDTPMLFDAPYYVIAAEFLLALPLPWMARRVVTGSVGPAIVLGVVEGLWMYPSVWLPHRIFG
jgi:hypothetical protein